MRKFKLTVIIATLLSINISNGFIKKNTTGEDNRVDLFQINNAFIQNFAKATLTLMTKKNAEKLLKKEKLPSLFEKGFSFYPDPLQSFSLKAYPCDDSKYAHNPSIGHCSGFLVGKDILITAGHCVADQCDDSLVWVKGFAYNSNMEITISKDDIFTCKKIIKRELESPTPVYFRTIDPRFEDPTPDTYDYQNVIDYAVIKIDQKEEVLNQNVYLKPRLKGQANIGDELIMVGNPLGMPTKVTTNGYVLEHRLNRVVVTNLDAFKGNSGSAVINTATGMVEGILSRTGPSFEKKNNNSCFSLKMSDEDEVAPNELSELTPMTMIPGLGKIINP